MHEFQSQSAEVSVDISSGTVLLMTLFMAGAAGLGTIPFFFTGKLSKEVAALANAVACGVMIACSFDLIHEGQPYGGNLVIAGVVLGKLVRFSLVSPEPFPHTLISLLCP